MRTNKDIGSILEVLIKNALSPFAVQVHLDRIEIGPPKDHNFGDLSTNVALKISRLTRQDPLKVAEAIVSCLKREIDRSTIKNDIEDIRNLNGFINFFFKKEYYYKQLRQILAHKEKFGQANLGKARKVLIEFVSANPTGPLSIAHARQAAVGDVLANVLDFLGFKVKREYYLNDEGSQIDILGESIALRLKELSGEKIEFPQDHYQGQYIYDIARELKNRNYKSKSFSNYGVKYIRKIIKKELDDFGVRFDYWHSQKDLRKKGKVERAINLLKRKGFIYERDGAIWLRSSYFDDDKDRVVVKKDGNYTYIASDIAYHQDKYKRGFSWLINFWGPDHHGYVSRLKAAIEALGKGPDSLTIIIVQLASIFRNARPIQMSTRKGQYISLREVLDEVGRDTSRFFFLMRRTSSHLDFDLGIAKRHTPENPVYYIQYAHARIHGIINKTKRAFNLNKADLTLLKQKEELRLLSTLSRFPYYLHIVLKTLDPYIMTVYMQGLANDFHKFYDRHRVLAEDKELSLSRLALIEGTRIILAVALKLLGLSRPEKM